MKHVMILICLALLCAPIAHAEKTGNGGDSCEAEINATVADIQKWIAEGGAKDLKLPKKLSLRDYEKKMQAAIENLNAFECVTTPILVNGAEKTCANNGVDHVECNFDRFMKLVTDKLDDEKYKLVHHELAGLAGLETNNGQPQSDYAISRQLGAHLENVLVKRLVVRPTPSNGKITVQVPEGVDYEKIEANFDGSFTVSKPTVFVEGAAHRLYRHSTRSPDSDSIYGLCRLLGAEYVSVTEQRIRRDAQSGQIALLDENGKFVGVERWLANPDWHDMRVIDQIICRPAEPFHSPSSRPVELKLPSPLFTVEKSTPNFDGSVTYTLPRVWVASAYQEISLSGQGVCRLLGHQDLVYVKKQPKSGIPVLLRDDGTLQYGFHEAADLVLQIVTCK